MPNTKLKPHVVTENGMRIVGEVIRKNHMQNSNHNDILAAVCDELENRQPPNVLEQRLSQMHMRTTDDILYLIDLYLAGVDLKLFA